MRVFLEDSGAKEENHTRLLGFQFFCLFFSNIDLLCIALVGITIPKDTYA